MTLYRHDSLRLSTLRLALRAALTSHRPDQLHAQLLRHGPQIFARALAGNSVRTVADTLSLLPPVDRAAVYGQLPILTRWALRSGPKQAAHLRTAPMDRGAWV